jgi:DNA-binding response OmpR family regulator
VPEQIGKQVHCYLTRQGVQFDRLNSKRFIIIERSMPTTILLTGADRDLISLLRHALVLDGYEVHTAFDAPGVRRILKNLVPHLTIGELVTAGDKGLEMLCLVRRQTNNPVMFLALPSDEARIEAAFAAGADAYLAVPFSPGDLKTGVHGLLAWKRAEQPVRAATPPPLRGLQSHTHWQQVMGTRRRAGLTP